MIILEFLVFVISSGLFCSEKFRNHIWAVIVAGAIATGSSLLFVYDLGARLAGHEKPPAVVTKIVKQTVVKVEKPSQPAAAGSPHSCLSHYPAASLTRHEEGVTALGFRILTDGTVDAVKVLTSSGSDSLDEAAVNCVSNWHYRPAIKDGQLVETVWKASVKWVVPKNLDQTAETAPPKPEDQTKPAVAAAPKDAPAERHPWYDVTHWFSGGSDNKDDKSQGGNP